MKAFLTEFYEKALYQILAMVFGLMGYLSLEQGRRAGAAMGRLIYRFNKRHRRIARENIDKSLDMGPKEKSDLVKTVFENLGMVLFELAWSLRLNRHQLFRYFKIQGLEHIHQAYREDKGVLALTAHFGNWELLTVIAAMIAHPLSIVYRPLDFQPLERFIVDFRSRFGGRQIPKQRAFRTILTHLRQKDMVALLMDQNVSIEEGVFGDYFGEPACTNKGMALLAIKTRAPVVPVFLWREPGGFCARFHPALPLSNTGDRIKDVEINTERYNQIIESVVRERPEQWFWVHRRWNSKITCPWPRRES